MKSLILLASLVLSSAVFAAPQAQESFSKKIQFDVNKFTLENGLTVLVHEDFRTPLVSFHQWYRVGSKDERPGMTGIAHFFEHLMFKGTKKYSSEQFEKLIQANGGTNNAFTSYDYTGYYVDLPADKLELILDIESDRTVNLVFNEEKIQKEREVVKEERRWRVDNRVEGYMGESMFSTIFKVHPYRWPVIGYMRDLNSITMDQFKAFYKTYYAPNNAVIVISGAVKTDKVKKLIKKYYSKIPAQKIVREKYSQEPKQSAPRKVTLRKDVSAPYLAMGYRIMEAGHPEQYAIDLMSNILSQGDSSRLYRRLIYKEQRVSKIYSYAYTPQNPGVFEVFAALKQGQSVNRVRSSINSELEKMKKTLVTEKELEKAKNQVMNSYVRALKTISGKARAIASNEILFGDYKVMYEDLDKYMAVTREDIRAVAKKYLRPQSRNTVLVLPNKKGSGKN